MTLFSQTNAVRQAIGLKEGETTTMPINPFACLTAFYFTVTLANTNYHFSLIL